VERSLLVRWPFASWLVDGSKRIEVRRLRHQRVGERIGIIATKTPWGSPAYLGEVTLGHCRPFSVHDADQKRVRDIIKRAKAAPERIVKYQGDRETLYAWEVSDPEQCFPREVTLKGGHQTWVRSSSIEWAWSELLPAAVSSWELTERPDGRRRLVVELAPDVSPSVAPSIQVTPNDYRVGFGLNELASAFDQAFDTIRGVLNASRYAHPNPLRRTD
jgi:hypothetical protein